MTCVKRRYSPEERALLTRYVTDVDGDTYCIFNLPEEVIAVIFAYVSRSPLSFRDTLLKLLESDELDVKGLPGGLSADELGAGADGRTGGRTEEASERARQFHERWT